MELPDNPEQFIAESQLRRAEIQNQLARSAAESATLDKTKREIHNWIIRRIFK